MLILEPKFDEWFVLKDLSSGRTIGKIKLFLREGQKRIAFDIPVDIQVKRVKSFKGVKNGNRGTNKFSSHT